MRLFRVLYCSMLVIVGTFATDTLRAQVPAFDDGFKPFGAYHGGNVDTVNLINGHAMLNIPILSYLQRGQLTLTFFLQYTLSNQWYVYSWQVGKQIYYRWKWSGGGVGVNWDGNYYVPAVYSGEISTEFIDPSGAFHTMGYVGAYPAAGILESNDATGFQLNAVNS